MKRKDLNVSRLKNIIAKDKKISEIYSKFKSKILKYKNQGPFVVGVSGGPDSMALAALSNFLKHEKKNRFFFVLIDHAIRKNSHQEALKVKKILKKNNISLETLRNRKKIKNNIQKNARDIRYKLLLKYCKKNKAKSILVAHHQDDQVETFLIRLSRGSGIEGLSSMSEKTKLNGVNLIRPLLDFNKQQLIYISKKIFGKILKDPSNKDKKFLRTNIRELKGTLEKKGLDFDKIIRSIKNISTTKDAINFYVMRSIKKFVVFRNKETVIKLNLFRQEPDEIRFRIINEIIKKRTGSYYPPKSKKVLNLINGFMSNRIKKRTLSGCIFERRKRFLYIFDEF